MAQADTIIPPGVQGLDRYAYVNNSPLNFVDPTGHKPDCDGDGWCGDYSSNYSGGDAILDSWREQNDIPFNNKTSCSNENMSIVCNNHPANSDVTLCEDCATYASGPFTTSYTGMVGFWELDQLDAIGIRFIDLSGWVADLPILGGSFSIDLVYNFRSNELGLIPTGSLLGGIGEGGSQSESLVLIYDAPNNSALTGESSGAQIDLTAGIGISASYSHSKSPTEGEYPQIYTIGPSHGVEVSVSGSYGISQNLVILPPYP